MRELAGSVDARAHAEALRSRIARANGDDSLSAGVGGPKRGATGAHVIVPGAGEAPDSDTLGDAALLAAHFSSFRGATGVEVAWTLCKYVRKDRRAPAGSVMVTQEKVMRVRLDEDRLAALLTTEGG